MQNIYSAIFHITFKYFYVSTVNNLFPHYINIFPSSENTVYILLKNSWAIQCEDTILTDIHSKYPLGYRKLAKLTFIGLAITKLLFFSPLLLSL